MDGLDSTTATPIVVFLCVYFRFSQRINYFDSMGGSGKNVTNSLLDWLEDEDDDKNGDDGTFDPDDWTTEGTNVATTPQQVFVRWTCMQ